MQQSNPVDTDEDKTTRHPAQLCKDALALDNTEPMMQQTNTEHRIECVIAKWQIEDTGTQPASPTVRTMVLHSELHHFRIDIDCGYGHAMACQQRYKTTISTWYIEHGTIRQVTLSREPRHNLLFTPIHPGPVDGAIALLLINTGPILHDLCTAISHQLFFPLE
jgi:hypothetical protein